MLAVVFLISRFTEVTEIAEVLQKARWSILLVAVLFIALLMLASAAAYRAIYRELGLRPPTLPCCCQLGRFHQHGHPHCWHQFDRRFPGGRVYKRGFARAKVTIAWAPVFAA